MLVPKRSLLSTLAVLLIVVLTGCNLGQAAQPTATAVDLGTIQTAAAATIIVQLTQIASAAPPSFTPTTSGASSSGSSVSSASSGQAITDTPAAGGVSATDTPLVINGTTIDLSPSPIPSLTPISLGTGGGSGGPVCKNSQYGGDITIPDGTVMKPWQKFIKAWKVRNTGTCTWDQGFSFRAWAGPPSLGTSTHITPYVIGNNTNDWVPAGGAVDIYINMYAPGDPGDYVAHWAMYDDLGKQFGGDFTVAIKVVK